MRIVMGSGLSRIWWIAGLAAVFTLSTAACAETASPTSAPAATRSAVASTETLEPSPIPTLTAPGPTETTPSTPTSTPSLVWCIRSSVVNKWVLYANPFLRFEQESGFLSFRKPSNNVVNYGYRTLAASHPSPTPTIRPTSAFNEREIGEVEGVTFIVGEGSEATFTVEEKLSRLPLPNDAVVRTTAISGEVHLDGRTSMIKIELHKLESDQARRDRYIWSTMFPNHPDATFTLDDARPIPEGFNEGEVATTQITGRLDIRGVQVPITFEIEARDDGDVIFILGRTSFVWGDFGMPAPNIRGFVQVTDEVSVEILLAVRPAL